MPLRGTSSSKRLRSGRSGSRMRPRGRERAGSSPHRRARAARCRRTSGFAGSMRVGWNGIQWSGTSSRARSARLRSAPRAAAEPSGRAFSYSSGGRSSRRDARRESLDRPDEVRELVAQGSTSSIGSPWRRPVSTGGRNSTSSAGGRPVSGDPGAVGLKSRHAVGAGSTTRSGGRACAAERVGDDERLRRGRQCPGSRLDGDRNQSLPYVSANSTSSGRELVGIGLDRLEGDPAVLELPPAVGRHPRVADGRGKTVRVNGCGLRIVSPNAEAASAGSTSKSASRARRPDTRAPRARARRRRFAPRRRRSTPSARRPRRPAPTEPSHPPARRCSARRTSQVRDRGFERLRPVGRRKLRASGQLRSLAGLRSYRAAAALRRHEAHRGRGPP